MQEIRVLCMQLLLHKIWVTVTRTVLWYIHFGCCLYKFDIVSDTEVYYYTEMYNLVIGLLKGLKVI